MSQSYSDAQDTTILDTAFKVRMMDPLDAMDLEVDILKTLGPALASLLSGLLKSDDTGAALSQLLDGIKSAKVDADVATTDDVDLSAIGASMDGKTQDALGDLIGGSLETAIGGLIDRLDKDQLRAVITKMASVTSFKAGDKWPELSDAGMLSRVFRGRMNLLHKWLAFAIRVQYQDFSSPA